MAKEMPFDEETMTLIMGLGGPDKPGQHGRKMVPAPENTAIDTITQIRDLCEDFLATAGKGDKPGKGGKEDKPSMEIDMEEE